MVVTMKKNMIGKYAKAFNRHTFALNPDQASDTLNTRLG